MSKTLTPFENHLKDVMSGYEAKYDASSWHSLERSLGKASYSNKSWLVAIVSTLLVSSAATVVIYKNRNTPSVAKISYSEARFSDLFSQSNAEQNASQYTNEVDPNLETDINGAIGTIGSTNNINNANNNDSNTTNVNTQQNIAAGDSQIVANNLNTSTYPVSGNSSSNNDSESVKSSAVVFNSNIKEACSGVEIDFQVTGPSKGSYLWNFGDGHYSNEVNPKHKFTKPGSYDVSLSITDDQGHITVKTMPDMVTIHPSPDASFEWDFVNEIPNAPTVKIKNTSEHAQDYTWKFGDGKSSSQISPVIAFDEKGKHIVALEVTNEYGCSDATVKQIAVNADMLGAQNGIVPGKDVFMPSSLKQNKTKFIMEIYSSDGKKVFETNNRNKGWDGTLPDGTNAKVGDTYHYKVIVTSDITKDEKYYNGTLSINP